jgi:hypothetical protein
MQVAHKLRKEGNVLVGAGAHFRIEHHLRITHGLKPDVLEAALQRISSVLTSMSVARSEGQSESPNAEVASTEISGESRSGCGCTMQAR